MNECRKSAKILSCSGDEWGSNRVYVRRDMGCIQVLVVIRETTTAKAMRTPQRHLSHTTCRQVAVQPRLPSPAPVVETARPFRGRTTPTVLGKPTGGWAPNTTLGVRVTGKQVADVTESEGSDDDGVSGRPRSFSPMFGKGRRDGVQCWNREDQSVTVVEKR